MKTKKCRKCGRRLPNDLEHFYSSGVSKDGLECVCKECRGGSFDEEAKPGWRRCSACGQLFPIEKEHFSGWFDKGRNNYRYSPNCKQCESKRGLDWYAENKNDTNKLVFSQESRHKYYENYKSRHNDRIKAKDKKYRANNKEKLRVNWERRRAREKALSSDMTSEEWENAIRHFDHKCAYCGKETESLEMDHVIPVSEGGNMTRKNIVPACRSCNASKGGKDMHTWYKSKEFYDAERERDILRYLRRC